MKECKQTKVFVIDKDGKPCLPCSNRRARQLLKQDKATMYQMIPFTLKLNYIVNNPIGEFKFGIDDGAKHLGVAIINEETKEIVFTGQVELRQDVSRLVEQRANYRRSRRTRNLRYRKPRFNNRTRKNKLAPSQRYRKDVSLRTLDFFSKLLNIQVVKVEEVHFNHAKYAYGKYFSHVEIGKTYLKQQILNKNIEYWKTSGYITKARRLELGLSKTHINDAISIVYEEGNGLKLSSLKYLIKPKRTKIWENNPAKKCKEKNGFKHYDIVKSIHRTKGIVIGNIRSLAQKVIKLRTKFNDSFPVSYNKTKLLQRPNGLIFIYF